jgi:large subunit ribosomal protein L28
MSRTCEMCGKSTTFGNQYTRRGLAKAKGGVGKKVTGKTQRKFLVNLQKVRAVVNGGVQRIRVCAKCLHKGSVVKPYMSPKKLTPS